ncbi:protocadherin-17-like isoform X1 [Branchiostoma floridae]|uniref:Protocadherin-17-like isoform X1 n=1 Tax=Branchiostoma floridae TaxID=7739 RepID=A0A9J7MWU4_BRAFL|nr:protocadherin-17-like isoform X1 [Branchiostoma floridae]
MDLLRTVFLGLLLELIGVSSARGIEFTYLVLEEELAGTHVGNLAQDLMVERASVPRTFQFLTESPYVAINNKTGELTTKRAIDREQLCPRARVCELKLEVAVLPSQVFQLVQVKISVQDKNDNTPRFRSTGELSLDLSEATAVDTRVPLDGAVDLDSDKFSIQSYTLQSSSDHMPFTLNTFTGVDGTLNVELVVNQPLDRERHSFYHLVLTAIDGGNPKLYDSQVLFVNILDTNDNSPLFDKATYSVDIMENTPVGSLVIDLNATDPDEGTNGEIVYSFGSTVPDSMKKLFALDSVTGKLTVAAPLDHEASGGPVYQLTVQAQDKGVNSAPTFATVIVNVGDKNDNAPKIRLNFVTTKNGPVVLSEDVPVETFLAYLTVVDKDGGLNGKVNVTLLGTDGLFGLQLVADNQYLIVTRAPLDRETKPTFNVTVAARDAGTPSRTTYKSFKVVLTDVNDNPPDFGSGELLFDLTENNAPGVSVGRVTATDPDEGDNGVVRYSIRDDRPTKRVYVDPVLGTIVVNNAMDREETSLIEVTVVATDSATPPLEGTAKLKIKILDENDNAPSFYNNRYAFHIAESVEVKTQVGQVIAADRDTGRNAKLAFAISSGDMFGKFSIDPQNGELYTTGKLDYEQKKKYELVVSVRDNGDPQKDAKCIVNIFIQDVNDNAPKITFPNTNKNVVYVPITSKPGFLATSIQATDADEGANGELSYSITNGNRRGIFAISDKGDIRTVKVLKKSWEGLHSLTITVTDHGATPQSASTVINIILDSTVTYNGTQVIGGGRYGDYIPSNQSAQEWNKAHIPASQDDDRFSIPIIIVIALSAVLVLLVSIVVIVIIKCRRLNKEDRTYNCRQAETTRSNSTGSLARGQKRNNQRDLVVTINETPVEIDYKVNNRKEDPDGQESSSPESLADTSPPDSESKLLKKEVPAGEEHDADESGAEHKEGSERGDEESEVSRLLTRLKGQNTSDDSLNTVLSNHDSGRGDSDREVRANSACGSPVDLRPQSCDGSSMKGETASETEPDLPPPPPPTTVLSRCTSECRILGHSDRCWMPVPPNNHIPNPSTTGNSRSSPTHPSNIVKASKNLSPNHKLHSPENLKILGRVKDLHNEVMNHIANQPRENVSNSRKNHHVTFSDQRPSPSGHAYTSPSHKNLDNPEENIKYVPYYDDPRFTGHEGPRMSKKPLCLSTFDPHGTIRSTMNSRLSAASSDDSHEPSLYHGRDMVDLLDAVRQSPTSTL